jgi:hypothetical protein
MIQQLTDNYWQAEARSEETKKFIQEYTEKIKSLSPRQKSLLEKHREVVEQNRLLADIFNEIAGKNVN